MTIEEVLAAEGYTAEEQTALLGNPKNKGLLTKILQQSEEGTTALLKAQELETSIRKFNDETVIPYGAKKDAEAAQARGEAARLTAIMESMESSGYTLPEGWKQVQQQKADPVKVEPQYVQREDFDKQGDAYMRVVSISNRYRKLTQDELDVSGEYEKFKTEKRPNERFGDYIDRKYDLSAKETAAAAQKKNDYEEKLRKEGEERFQKANPRSANDGLQPARASKFDRFQKLPDDAKNGWQTQAGREKATQTRMEKYRDILVQ